ncbi:DUF934 domain-containing protein [Pontibacterium granulatum]|uniref:DUF934 domain-containing protein n=1 Tax=Pontibacterium granulatum TaxID=2036029 RepID=UPI00249A8960|nr:DUF934 domain-containing protein [Pontibacterium granulatum]MDI3326291.1 DUF934 domain-containing protein [Pontibacterium granulatum]
MPHILKNGSVQLDNWLMVAEEAAEPNSLTQGQLILPIEQWLKLQPDFEGLEHTPGFWLDAGQVTDEMEVVINAAPVVAIRFTSFTDGTGFSDASLVRETFGFTGELRATGALLPDQVPYLLRCGFDAIVLSEQKDLEQALQLLSLSAESYQGSVTSPRTPFHRRTQKLS